MTGIFLCDLILIVTAFILGACIFSFLNVVIYRVPKKMSFVKGHSICPSCGHRLGAPDLVPIFSYLLLGGKCRYCKTKIGSRDTWIELLGGLEAILCLIRFENYGAALTAFAFLCVLTVVTFLDIDTMEIEDGCHAAILVLAVISYVTMPGTSVAGRMIGAVCVSIPMLILSLLIPGAFGGGDIKLMAACGVFMGWKLTLIGMAAAILTGGFYGIWLLLTKRAGRKEHFAFGPFLCLGMAVSLFWGEAIFAWYRSVMFI